MPANTVEKKKSKKTPSGLQIRWRWEGVKCDPMSRPTAASAMVRVKKERSDRHIEAVISCRRGPR